jgi:hypothetical protein
VQQCVPTMALVPTDVQHVPTVGSQFPLLHNDTGHAGCLPPRKTMTDRQTWMGP